MKILKEIESPLLNRKRISFEIDHPGKSTPKKEDLRNQISIELKEKPELISVKHVYSKFGLGKSKVIANIYKNQEEFNIFEKKKEKKVKQNVEKKS